MIKTIIKLFIIISLLFTLTNISRDFEDLTTAVLVDWHGKNELTRKPTEEILAGQKISGEFKAGENNLGIVSVKFINVYGGTNNDRLVFRLKEIGRKSWYYENYYYTDQFLSDSYFPFGFPPVAGSKGKIYQFEIESLYGLRGNALSLSASDPVFKAKYKFSKSALLADKKELALFLVKKLGNYLSIYEVIAGLGIVIFSVVWGRRDWWETKSLRSLKEKVRRQEDLIFIISIFLLTLIVAGYFSTLNVYHQHDGIMLKPAIDVASGKMLFRDSYTQYGALTTLLQASAIKIFGQYLIVIRLLTAFFYALTGLILYLVWKRILPKWLSVLSCLLWISIATYLQSYFLPWSSVYAMFFQVLSLYLIYKFFECTNSNVRGWLYLFTSGTATALTFWCRQPVGVFLYAAYIFFFIFLKFRRYKSILKTLLIFNAGFWGTNFIFFLWLFVNHALYDWFLQSVSFAYLFGRTIGIGRGLIRPITSLIPVYRPQTPFYYYSDVLWVILPLSCFFIFFKLFRQTRIRKLTVFEIGFFALLFVSLSSWMQYFPVSERQHFYWAAAPMAGVTVYLIWYLSRYLALRVDNRNKAVHGVLFLVCLYAVFFPVTFDRLQKGIYRLGRKYETVGKPKVLAAMKLTKEEAIRYGQMAKEIDKYLEKYPGTKLVTNVPEALFLTFVAENENVHKLYLLNSSQAGQLYPDFKEKFNSFVREKKPLIVSQSYDLVTGYCQLYIPGNYNSVTVKAADVKKVDFKIVSFKAGPKAEIVAEINSDLPVIDAYVEEYDNAQKIRRWTVKEIEGYKKLSLESNFSKRYTLRLDEELKDGAKVIVKIMFDKEDCYVEKEVKTNG